MNFKKIAFTLLGIFSDFALPSVLCKGYVQEIFFLPDQSTVSSLRCFGQVVISSLSLPLLIPRDSE